MGLTSSSVPYPSHICRPLLCVRPHPRGALLQVALERELLPYDAGSSRGGSAGRAGAACTWKMKPRRNAHNGERTGQHRGTQHAGSGAPVRDASRASPCISRCMCGSGTSSCVPVGCWGRATRPEADVPNGADVAQRAWSRRGPGRWHERHGVRDCAKTAQRSRQCGQRGKRTRPTRRERSAGTRPLLRVQGQKRTELCVPLSSPRPWAEGTARRGHRRWSRAEGLAPAKRAAKLLAPRCAAASGRGGSPAAAARPPQQRLPSRRRTSRQRLARCHWRCSRRQHGARPDAASARERPGGPTARANRRGPQRERLPTDRSGWRRRVSMLLAAAPQRTVLLKVRGAAGGGAAPWRCRRPPPRPGRARGARALLRRSG